MKRDIIDSVLAGALASWLPIWQFDGPAEQIVTALGMAALFYIAIIFFRKEDGNAHIHNH